jgi:hypothetical protein
LASGAGNSWHWLFLSLANIFTASFSLAAIEPTCSNPLPFAKFCRVYRDIDILSSKTPRRRPP